MIRAMALFAALSLAACGADGAPKPVGGASSSAQTAPSIGVTGKL